MWWIENVINQFILKQRWLKKLFIYKLITQSLYIWLLLYQFDTSCYVLPLRKNVLPDDYTVDGTKQVHKNFVLFKSARNKKNYTLTLLMFFRFFFQFFCTSRLVIQLEIWNSRKMIIIILIWKYEYTCVTL